MVTGSTLSSYTSIYKRDPKYTDDLHAIEVGFSPSNYVNTVLFNSASVAGFDIDDYIDTDYSRPGQDVRYALDDTKLRSLGWEPKVIFDKEIKNVVNYYKNKFIW